MPFALKGIRVKLGLLALLACVLISRLPWLPSLVWLGGLFGIVIISILIRPNLCVLWALFWFLVFVWRAVQWGQHGLEYRLSAHWEGKDIAIVGVVDGFPVDTPRGQRFTLSDVRLQQEESLDETTMEDSKRFPVRLRLNSYRALGLRVGDEVQMIVRLKQPRGLVNPVGFDYERWLFSQRVGATGYVRTLMLRSESLNLGARIGRWRETIKANWLHHTEEGFARTVLLALVVGDKTSMTGNQRELIASAGLSHLLAISGMHIGLMAGLGYVIGRGVGGVVSLVTGGLVSGPRCSVVVALLFAVVYAVISGFGVPAQRALVMLVVFAGFNLFNVRIGSFDVLMLALAAVLMLQPMAFYEVGFWLSFVAVYVLLVLSRKKSQGRWQRLRQLLEVQVALAVLLSLLLFSANMPISLNGVWINLLAVPLVSLFVVPVAFLSSALMLADLPASWLVVVLVWSLNLFESGLLAMQSWLQITTITQSTEISWWAVALLLLGMGLALLPLPLAARCLASVTPVVWWSSSLFHDSEARLTLFDVGQGLAVIAESEGQTLIYDTGPAYPSGFDVGKDILIPYLSSRGVENIAVMIISHGDLDHRGGAVSLLQRFPTGRLIVGPGVALGHTAEPCQRHERFSIGSMRITMSPGSNQASSRGNDGSCVVLLDMNGRTFLLSGDIEQQREAELLAKPELLPPVDVVIAPHHGSKTSSTSAWVQQLQARSAVFSAGYRSRYGHPHVEVLERYREQGAELLCTSDRGAIQWHWGRDEAVEVQRTFWRHSRSPYWRYKNSPDCDKRRA